MSRWYVSNENYKNTLMSDTDIDRLIIEQKVSDKDLIRQDGTDTLEPVSSYFKVTKDGVFHDNSKPSQTIVFIIIVALSVFGLIFISTLNGAFKFGPMFFFAGAAIAGAANLYVSVNLWRYGNRKLKALSMRHGGGYKVLSLLLLIVSIPVSLYIIGYGYHLEKLEQAQAGLDDYVMSYEDKENRLYIRGYIGPDFDNDLKAQFVAHPKIETVEINSQGGLLSVAMQSVETLKAHKGLSVVVKEQCSSACLVFMSAFDERLADWNAVFGFHKSSSIINDYNDMGITSEISQKADRQLALSGMPREFLKHNYVYGSNTLMVVTSIQLFEKGYLAGLMNDDSAIDVQTAKIKKIAKMLELAKVKFNNWPFDEIVASLALAPAKIQDIIVEPLYRTLEKKDHDAFRQTFKNTIRQLIHLAMKSAAEEQLLEYTRVQFEQIVHLSEKERWVSCANYLNGNSSQAMKDLSEALLRQEFDYLKKLFVSANENLWVSKPFSPKATEIQTPIILNAVVRTSNIKAPTKAILQSKRLCLFSASMFTGILNSDSEYQADMIRAFLSTQ